MIHKDTRREIVTFAVLFAVVISMSLIFVRAEKPASPSPSASAPPNDFDFEKKDWQLDWCEKHHGVATVTFTRNHSNVLCVRPEVIIELPESPTAVAR